MWLDEDAPIRKRDLFLEKPFLNAPGTLGFAPDPHTMPFLQELGAFVTHPISRSPRQPANTRTCLPFPGGFLLHTGWPNPGIRRAIARYQRAWAAADLPVIVHLLGESPGMTAEMVRMLEGLENILAVEVGLPLGCSPSALVAYLDAASGELPVVISLPPDDMPLLLKTLVEQQPAAVHLQPPRGTLPDGTGRSVSGRLYGPATFPLALQVLQRWSDSSLRLIAGGGVFTQEEAQALLDSGAFAVGLDVVLWQIGTQKMFNHSPGNDF